MIRKIVWIATLGAIAMLTACTKGANAPAITELKIVDTVSGTGDASMEGDTVLVNYTGWLYENGKRGAQFDSSIGKDPFEVTIGVTPVIKGWTQGLVGMKIGGKRELLIPPALGYGSSDIPGAIPANSTLDFEIELLKLTKK
jgi:peptidylprolyl isomerase